MVGNVYYRECKFKVLQIFSNKVLATFCQVSNFHFIVELELPLNRYLRINKGSTTVEFIHTMDHEEGV